MEATSIDHETDELRAGMHAMWDAVAPAWEANADFTDERGATLADRLIELAAPAPGERVVELAAGAGGLGLEVARRLGEASEVVVSDVAPGMVAAAARRAAAAGLDRVATRVLDLEAIAEPESGFDVAFCREGLMLVPDPARAASEIHRILRPGGRVAVAVWGPRERNPWLGALLDSVSEELGFPVPPPGAPHPFSLSADGRLAEILSAAGFGDVTVGEVSVPYVGPSFADWWERTSALAGPVKGLLASLDAERVESIQARVRDAFAPYETAGGLEIPGVGLTAAGVKPAA